MIRLTPRIPQTLIAAAMLGLIIFTGYGLSHADRDDLSTAVFYVTWYDVGRAALEGLDGIQKVENGFRGFKEINTVYYDPTVITTERMEATLKKAETYLGTAK
jgi:prolipoprotein diacylglyceryltransferase